MINRRDLQIFLLIILTIIGGFDLVTSEDCWNNIDINIEKNSPVNKDYLKNVFRLMYGDGKDKDKVYTAKTDSGDFQWKICGKLDGVSDNKAGLVDAKKTVIALYSPVSVTGIMGDKSKTSSIALSYKGGAICKNNGTRSATINLICSKDWTEAQFIRTFAADDCTYGLTLMTDRCFDVEGKIAALTSTPAPAVTTTTAPATKTSSSHMSPVSGFFLFLLAVAFGYCVIGFLYKRYVLGARGAQQIPNYLFWIRVSQWVQDCISNRSSSSRYTTSSSRTAEYDRANAADVQLMNDGEDMKYDQPPLVVGPGGGQTSTFRQQALNVAPNTPAMNAQRHQQQQESLLLPQDDADERLLQV